MLIKKMAAFATATFWFTTASFAQNRTPEDLVNKWVQAWNSHDATAYGKLFTRDAHFIVVYDEINEGQEKIAADFKVAHEGWAKLSKMSAGKVSIQRLSGDIAVLYFNVMAELTTPPPTPKEGRTVQLVAVKGRDGWLISSGQLSKPNCP